MKVRRIRYPKLSETGAIMTLMAVTLPVLLAIVGIVVDTGLYGLSYVRLSSAADAAALAAVSAVDFDYYAETDQVRLVEADARRKAEVYGGANCDGLTETDLVLVTPRKVRVTLRAKYSTIFLVAFGIREAKLEASAEAQVNA